MINGDLPVGNSYALRVNEVDAIYDHYTMTGMSNRDIRRRYIYPRFGIVERTFYNYLKRVVVYLK